MNLTDLHDHFGRVFADNPQKATLAQMAVAELRSALGRLAALGQRFALVPHEAVATEPQQYPKMVFNGASHRLVHDEVEETDAAADGWVPHGAEPAPPEPMVEPPADAPIVSFPIPQEPAPPVEA